MSDWRRWKECNSFYCPSCKSEERMPRKRSDGTMIAGWTCVCRAITKRTPTGMVLSAACAVGWYSSPFPIEKMESARMEEYVSSRQPANIEGYEYEGVPDMQ